MFFKRKEYHKTCEVCGKEFVAHAHNAKYCPDCRSEHRRERLRLYMCEYRRQHPPTFKSDPFLLEKHREYQRNRHNKKYRSNHEYRQQKIEYSRARCRAGANKIAKRRYYAKNRELINLNRRIAYYDKCIARWNSLADA